MTQLGRLYNDQVTFYAMIQLDRLSCIVEVLEVLHNHKYIRIPRVKQTGIT